MEFYRLRLILVGIAFFLSIWYVNSINTYMTYKDTPVEVLQTYSGVSSGKHSLMQFVAVYKTQDGVVFDRFISASQFYKYQPGDKIVISLRPYDIRQNTFDNMVKFFGVIVYWAIAGCLGVGCIVIGLWPSPKPDPIDKL